MKEESIQVSHTKGGELKPLDNLDELVYLLSDGIQLFHDGRIDNIQTKRVFKKTLANARCGRLIPLHSDSFDDVFDNLHVEFDGFQDKLVGFQLPKTVLDDFHRMQVNIRQIMQDIGIPDGSLRPANARVIDTESDKILSYVESQIDWWVDLVALKNKIVEWFEIIGTWGVDRESIIQKIVSDACYLKWRYDGDVIGFGNELEKKVRESMNALYTNTASSDDKSIWD